MNTPSLLNSENFASLADLASAVNDWCGERGVRPASGQTASELSERNLRYYRTLGLLDGPQVGGGYGARHFLQLAAIRVLQSRGLPLRRIQELLYSRDEAELRELLERAEAEPPATSARLAPVQPYESLEMVGLTGDFSLVCRNGARPSRDQLARLIAILSSQPHPVEPAHP